MTPSKSLKYLLPDRSFLRSMATVAVPVALQNLIISSLSLVDTAMISPLGEASIASVGIVSQFFFLFICVAFSVASTAGIFYARFHVSERVGEMRSVTLMSVSVLSLLGACFAAAAWFAPRLVLGLYTPDPELIEIGSGYLFWLAPCFLFFGPALVFSAGFRTTGYPRMPLFISAAGFVCNVILNTILIFGYLGFPALGVVGAAVATTFSRLLEIILDLIWMRRLQAVFAIGIEDVKRPERGLARAFFRALLPIFLTDFLWGLSQNAYQKAYAHLGQTALAAVQLSASVETLLFVLSRGICAATIVDIGALLGRDHIEAAKAQSRRYLSFQILTGLIVGLILMLAPQAFLIFYVIDSERLRLSAAHLLMIRGLFMPIKFGNDMLVGGILRTGADLSFTLSAEALCVWIYSVPAAFIGAQVLGLSIEWTYLAVSLVELVKFVPLFIRYKSGRWIRALH